MARYLLDTNILSDIVRNPSGPVATRISRFSRTERRNICTSIICAGELRYGATKSGSVRLNQRVEEILKTLQVFPFEEDADRHYARIRTHLEGIGSPIGGNDLLIAAQAVSTGCILVSDNIREFGKVPGLQLENWLRPRS